MATPWAREHRGVPEGQVGWLEAIAPAGCCYCPSWLLLLPLLLQCSCWCGARGAVRCARACVS